MRGLHVQWPPVTTAILAQDPPPSRRRAPYDVERKLGPTITYHDREGLGETILGVRNHGHLITRKATKEVAQHANGQVEMLSRRAIAKAHSSVNLPDEARVLEASFLGLTTHLSKLFARHLPIYFGPHPDIERRKRNQRRRCLRKETLVGERKAGGHHIYVNAHNSAL